MTTRFNEVDGSAGNDGGALGRLIRQRMQELGLSFASAAAKAGMPRSTLHALASTAFVRPPSMATLRAVAKAIAVPEELARDAAMIDAGLAPSSEKDGGDADMLWLEIRRLSPSARGHVHALVQSLLSVEQPSSTGELSGPRT